MSIVDPAMLARVRVGLANEYDFMLIAEQWSADIRALVVVAENYDEAVKAWTGQLDTERRALAAVTAELDELKQSIAKKPKRKRAEPKTKLEHWAAGGYFIVIDRRPTQSGDREDFHVRSFTKEHELRMHTWHTGETSMLMEVDAWLKRGAKPFGYEAEKSAAIVAKWNAVRKKVPTE